MTTFLARLAAEPAVLVSVHQAEGSVPRGPGAWMAVFADGIVGTIGGGRLEFEAIEEARGMPGASTGPVTLPGTPPRVRRYPLGPALGQCCGGVVHLAFEPVSAADVASLGERLRATLAPVALFGGGHVGRALVEVLGTLPFDVRWIDSRDEVFPPELPANVACEHSDPIQAAVRELSAGSKVVIMSFSHAEDLDVVAACLMRLRLQDDLPFIGLIGSRTKWTTFRHRLEARGFSDAELARVTCPIGIEGIPGKEPEVIAVAVAAQLLRAG